MWASSWTKQRQHLVLGLDREHVLAELLPVPGALPQRPVDELRGVDLDVAGPLQAPADVALEGAVQRPAVRVPEHRPRRLLLEVVEAHLPAEPAVVAPLRLRQHRQVGVELILASPGGAVDPLQHGVAGVATPVSAGELG